MAGAVVNDRGSGVRSPSVDMGKVASRLCPGWNVKWRSQCLPHVPRTRNYKSFAEAGRDAMDSILLAWVFGVPWRRYIGVHFLCKAFEGPVAILCTPSP